MPIKLTWIYIPRMREIRYPFSRILDKDGIFMDASLYEQLQLFA